MKKSLVLFVVLGMLVACSGKKEKKYTGKPVKIEFLETYSMQEIQFYWSQAIELAEAKQAGDSTGQKDLNDLMRNEDGSLKSLEFLVRPYGDYSIGYVKQADMAAVDALLSTPEIHALFPPDLQFRWSFKPEDEARTGGESYYVLYAIKEPESRKMAMTGRHIKDASVGMDESSGRVTIDLVMTEKGTDLWAQLTEKNINRCIAMCLDGKVISAPRVMAAITMGNTQISGAFSVEEAEELAAGIMAGTRR